MSEFRIFENGSIWRPPTMNFYHRGLPLELYEDHETEPKSDDDEPLPIDKNAVKASEMLLPDSKPLMPPPNFTLPPPVVPSGKRGQLTEK